ncbi:MAG: DUF2807 domain-containing protein [Bacteroidales bacterium]|nr:DUF2807 domain-containing protein [Bacteroidales bacterium]
MTCKSFSASTTGSGDIEVGMITADRIKASTSGKGNISLVCKDVGDIEAKTSGSGSIYLGGNTNSLDQKSSGNGRVNNKNISVQDNKEYYEAYYHFTAVGSSSCDGISPGAASNRQGCPEA